MATDVPMLESAEPIWQVVVPFAWTLVGAVLLWVVAGWGIAWGVGRVRRAVARGWDETRAGYVATGLRVVSKGLLAVGILELCGVDTSGVAAILAGVGAAIGAAWGGLLANFAAGMFLVVLRPFNKGDIVTVAGVTGVVREIGLFATALDAVDDHRRRIVGNDRVVGDAIANHSHHPVVRIETSVQVGHGVDALAVAERIRQGVAAVPGVVAEPGPEVGVREANWMGTVLFVRPYVRGGLLVEDEVLAGVHRVVAAATAGLPVPAEPREIVSVAR